MRTKVQYLFDLFRYLLESFVLVHSRKVVLHEFKAIVIN